MTRHLGNIMATMLALCLFASVAGVYYLTAYPFGLLGNGGPFSSIAQLAGFSPSGERLVAVEEQFQEATAPVEADTFVEFEHTKRLGIYDMSSLGMVLDYDYATFGQLHTDIDANAGIPASYKPVFHEYCDALQATYPGIELRVLHENLKSLRVVEYSREELQKLTKVDNSYGCYNCANNAIYVRDDLIFSKGTWAYQVMFHELSHCLRTHSREVDGWKVIVESCGPSYNGGVCEEALNTLFAVSLFDYEEDMLAYQLQSNCYGILVECLDDYSLEDYVEHSESWFACKLDQQNGDGRAVEILDLMQRQYEAYHSDEGIVRPSEFKPIYEYLGEMYFEKHAHPGMSVHEQAAMVMDLADRVTHLIPDEYGIEPIWFTEIYKEWSRHENR